MILIMAIAACCIVVCIWWIYVVQHSAIKNSNDDEITSDDDQWGEEELPIERVKRSHEYLHQENSELKIQIDLLNKKLNSAIEIAEKYKLEARNNKIRMTAFNAAVSDLEKANERIIYLEERIIKLKRGSWVEPK